MFFLRSLETQSKFADYLQNRCLGLQPYWKDTLSQVFSSEYCQVFKSSFFVEHFLWLRLKKKTKQNKTICGLPSAYPRQLQDFLICLSQYFWSILNCHNLSFLRTVFLESGVAIQNKPISGQVDSPELPETPETTEMTENFTNVTKYLTRFQETLINYV